MLFYLLNAIVTLLTGERFYGVLCVFIFSNVCNVFSVSYFLFVYVSVRYRAS